MERLGTAIKLGLLAPGTRLPAERELCEQLGIARSTLRQALTALDRSGHLRRASAGAAAARRPAALRRRAPSRDGSPRRWRDAFELALTRAALGAAASPLLGICRGMRAAQRRARDGDAEQHLPDGRRLTMTTRRSPDATAVPRRAPRARLAGRPASRVPHPPRSQPPPSVAGREGLPGPPRRRDLPRPLAWADAQHARIARRAAHAGRRRGRGSWRASARHRARRYPRLIVVDFQSGAP